MLPYDGEHFFFHDLSVEEAEAMAKELRAQPIMKSPLSQASYLDLPCAYLLSAQDRAFSLVAQEMMVKMARDQGGNMSTYSCEAGHSPFLSWTQATADSIIDFGSKL